MDVNEMLKFADEIVFKNRGKHLDDLEQAILRGVWQNEKYSKVAEDFHCTEGHVRDVASDLWKILSDILEEDVSKCNLRSTIERQQLLFHQILEKILYIVVTLKFVEILCKVQKFHKIDRTTPKPKSL
jgi:hypothetical protein